MRSEKSLSRQSLKLDKKQFAVLESIGDVNRYLILKPKHVLKRNQMLSTLHGQNTADEEDAATVLTKDYWIGRLPDCDLICEDPLVSGHHVKFVCNSQTFETKARLWYHIIDNSTNGTVLDGKLMDKGRVYKLQHNSAIKLPCSTSDRGSFTFKLKLPELCDVEKKEVEKLYVCSDEEKRAERDEGLESTRLENSYNSLNLRIINETQAKYKKRYITSYSLKHYKTNPTSMSSLGSTDAVQSLKNGIAKLVGKIAGKQFRAKESISTVQSNTVSVKQLQESHQMEKRLLLDLMKEMSNDVQADKLNKWRRIITEVDSLNISS